MRSCTPLGSDASISVPSGTQNGVTFTVNADKSITITGTATADFTRGVFNSLPLPAATTLTISGTPGSTTST